MPHPRSPRRALIVALVVSCAAATTARSEVIQRDLAKPGDELIAFDTETELEWLHLSQTVGLSINDIKDGVDNSLQADGWRWATRVELCGLYATVGFPLEVCPTPNTVPPVPAAGKTPLVDLLGRTDGFAAYALFEPLQPPFSGYAWYDWQSFADTSRHFAQLPALIGHGARLGFRGHFLVRPVPSPSGTAPVFAALATLAGLRLRARSSPQAR